MFVPFDLSANYIRIFYLKNSIITQSYFTTSLLSTLLDDFLAPVTSIVIWLLMELNVFLSAKQK